MSDELRDRMLALLREIEWNGVDEGSREPVCPSCRGIAPLLRKGSSYGHTTDCTLAALLAELERKEARPASCITHANLVAQCTGCGVRGNRDALGETCTRCGGIYGKLRC